MVDINQFLKNFSQFAQLDFTGKEAEMGLLAKKYDENHNSIFENKELNAIKKDLSIFMNAEGNSEEMSMQELCYFYQSLELEDKTTLKGGFFEMMNKAVEANYLLSNLNGIVNDKRNSIEDLYRQAGRQKLDIYESDIDELVNLSPTQLERAKKFLYIKGRSEQIDGPAIRKLLMFPDQKLEKANQFLYIEERGLNQLTGSDIITLLELSDQKLDKANQFLYIEERGEDQFSGRDITELLDIPDEKMERSKKLFYIEGRKRQFDGYDIKYLSEISDTNFKKAEQFFHIEGCEQEFSGHNIAELVNLPDERIKRAKNLLHVEEREEQFRASEIVNLAQLSDKQFERAETLFKVEGREIQFSGYDIAELAKLSDDEFKRAQRLFNTKRNEKLLSGSEIISLAKLSDKQLEQALNLFEDEMFKENFSCHDIAKYVKLPEKAQNRVKDLLKDKNNRFGSDSIRLAELSDKKFDKAMSLYNITLNNHALSIYELTTLADLSDEEFEKAKKLLNNIDPRFNVYDIADFAALSEKQYKQAEDLFYLQDRPVQLSGGEIAALAKLSEADLNWAKKNLLNRNLDGYTCACIAKNRCYGVMRYLDTHSDIELDYTSGNSVKFRDTDGNFYTYNKSGLLETGKEKILPDTNTIKDRKQITISHKKLNVKHVITKGTPTNSRIPRVLSEVLTYCDDQNNVIRTVTLNTDPNTGTINVSETDAEGNQIPIQWESIDPDTGARITERHLHSQNGTTDFYAEEKDGLKITEYKITDNNGNELINIHQTFEQISNNKFISSINTTGQDEDTQIYEMEYLQNNIVKILDKKKNKITTINLNRYLTNSNSAQKLLPVIKQLPGHVLLEFAEKPLKLDYGEDNMENGYWDTDNSFLQVGNYEKNPIGENDNLLSTLTHELGHYLDLYNRETGKYSSNKNVMRIYEQEFKEFQNATTTAQQEYINYFTNVMGNTRGNQEKVAEAHAILNSIKDPSLDLRKLYLAQYFPRTMAEIMKLLLKEEGVNI